MIGGQRVTRCGLNVAGLTLLVLFGSFARVSAFAESRSLAFFAWSDPHVTTEGDCKHCLAAVEAMNALPGRKSPDAIGGVVTEPKFIFNAGDLTEWPTVAALKSYKEMIARLKWPSREIAGNHDNGGQQPSPTVLDYVREKHGGLNYTFDESGVHFICLYTPLARDSDSPTGPIFPETLRYLRDALARQPREKPIIVALHLCADAIQNMSELTAAMQGHNVILVLTGHYHQPQVQQFGGVSFVQLPSPASKIQAVSVVRVTENRVTVCPYDYARNEWMARPTLNAAIRGISDKGYPPPEKTTSSPIEGVLCFEDFAGDKVENWTLNDKAARGGMVTAHGFGEDFAADNHCFQVNGKAGKIGFLCDLKPGLRPERDVYVSFMTHSRDLTAAKFLMGVAGRRNYADWSIPIPTDGWRLVSLKTNRDIAKFEPGESYLRFAVLWEDDAETSEWCLDNFMIGYFQPPVLSVETRNGESVVLRWTPIGGITTGDRLRGYRITASGERARAYDPKRDVSGLLDGADRFTYRPRAASNEALYFTLWAEMESGARWHGLNQVRWPPAAGAVK